LKALEKLRELLEKAQELADLINEVEGFLAKCRELAQSRIECGRARVSFYWGERPPRPLALQVWDLLSGDREWTVIGAKYVEVQRGELSLCEVGFRRVRKRPIDSLPEWAEEAVERHLSEVEERVRKMDVAMERLKAVLAMLRLIS
jgi:hypothetical protein